jgi:hypothetical protein
MPVIDTSPIPEQSHPLSINNPPEKLNEIHEDNSQAHDVFLQHLVIKPPHYQQQGFRKSHGHYTSSIGSIIDRTPSSLFELKQQRLLAAADRKKRIIARIVSIVGLLIILLCAAIVTLTLKMAPKIDELVRTKAGAHQLVHLVSRMNTSPPTTVTTITTIRPDNYTINGSVIEKSIFRTRPRPFI